MKILAVIACLGAFETRAQAPVKTKLKKVLVLDKSPAGLQSHFESRRDFNAALRELAEEKGFEVTTLGQGESAATIAREFSEAGLSGYQAVVAIYTDGIHSVLDSAARAALEAYVEGSGGLIMVHSAQSFITNWHWMTEALAESFYGPFGDNQPRADLVHDLDGLREASETHGIFAGLTAPSAFLDEYYSFRNSPRGKPGVTVLVRVEENTYSQPVRAPMGLDHPVIWSRRMGEGSVVNFSLGHSWSADNVYAAAEAYLKRLFYGVLRYVALDFRPCSTCGIPDAIGLAGGDGKALRTVVAREAGAPCMRVSVRDRGAHEVVLLDVSGRAVFRRMGSGAAEYSLPAPSRGGIYFVVARSGGAEIRRRLTLL